MTHRLGWLSLLLLSLPAQGGGAPPGSSTELRLEIGASATVSSTTGSAAAEPAGPTLIFRAVESDNRCPADVSCFIAGEGVVRLEGVHGEERKELLLRIPPGGHDRAEVFGYQLEGRLLPGTRADRRIEPEEYVLELCVRR